MMSVQGLPVLVGPLIGPLLGGLGDGGILVAARLPQTERAKFAGSLAHAALGALAITAC